MTAKLLFPSNTNFFKHCIIKLIQLELLCVESFGLVGGEDFTQIDTEYLFKLSHWGAHVMCLDLVFDLDSDVVAKLCVDDLWRRTCVSSHEELGTPYYIPQGADV